MAIFVDKKTKVIVQGITGRDGSFHTEQMIKYGTNIVAGITPGKGGASIFGVPIYDGMAEAVARTGANTSVIFVPPIFAADAIFEAARAGVSLVVCITEGIPTQDVIKVCHFLNETGVRLIGPNCPGIISPEMAKVGILPAQIFAKGPVGVISRSGTLTYEIVYNLTLKGLGQSTCLGIGGDPIIGTSFIDCLRAFEDDPATKGIVLIGEIGGSDEEMAAEYIKKHVSKPVVAFIAGRSAPAGKRMGHAGAIISGSSGLAEDKIKAFKAVGVPVAEIPSQIAELMAQRLAEYKKTKKKPVKRPKKKIKIKKAAAVSGAKKIGKKKKAKKAAKKSRVATKIVRKKVVAKKAKKKAKRKR